MNKTGCLVPCEYSEYRVVGEPQGGTELNGMIGAEQQFALGYNFACTDRTINKEAWVGTVAV